MNWEAIGALGEIGGAIAVFATLLYLASQLKQNSAATKAVTYSSTTDGWHDYLQSLSIEDIELMTRMVTDHENLTQAEFYRCYYLTRVMFRRMEHDYYQYRAGTFAKETWDAYAIAFQRDTYSNPGTRAMWELQSDFVDPEFKATMQPLVEAARLSVPENLPKMYSQLLKDQIGNGA